MRPRSEGGGANPEQWPQGWDAQNFACFPLSRHNFLSFFSLLGGLLGEFWLCLMRRDPEMCTFGVLGSGGPKESHNLIMALHDDPAHCFMALHDTKPVDFLALGTHRHRRSPERSEIVALHNLSQGIVIEHVTLSNQSHSPVLYLLLLALFSSLLHLLTHLRSSSRLMVVSRGPSAISTLCSTGCITITGTSGTIRFPCRGL